MKQKKKKLQRKQKLNNWFAKEKSHTIVWDFFIVCFLLEAIVSNDCKCDVGDIKSE